MILRVSALAAAGILAICIAWIVYATFSTDGTVEPTVQMASQPGEPGPLEVLGDRTRLMGPRSQTGPSPEGEVPAEAFAEQDFVTQQGVPGSDELVGSWLEERENVQDILQPEQFLDGITSVPYREADVLQQPQGRTWRSGRNDIVRFAGGWVIVGFSLLLALFLAIRGRVPIVEGKSGEKVTRFNTFERANHWLAAGSFIILALTGLVIIYGKSLLLPWMGPAAFSTLSSWSAWLHMGFAVPFTLGIAIMLAIWVVGNLPSRLDWPWLKRFGGFLSDSAEHPPARRFNAGQKLIFWAVILFGTGLVVSGVTLMYPFAWAGYEGMQWAQIIHAALALIMIAVIIGHIYIGTVGMEGAFHAMWDGKVDRNWAKEHHSIWYGEITNGEDAQSRGTSAPAE